MDDAPSTRNLLWLARHLHSCHWWQAWLQPAELAVLQQAMHSHTTWATFVSVSPSKVRLHASTDTQPSSLITQASPVPNAVQHGAAVFLTTAPAPTTTATGKADEDTNDDAVAATSGITEADQRLLALRVRALLADYTAKRLLGPRTTAWPTLAASPGGVTHAVANVASGTKQEAAGGTARATPPMQQRALDDQYYTLEQDVADFSHVEAMQHAYARSRFALGLDHVKAVPHLASAVAAADACKVKAAADAAVAAAPSPTGATPATSASTTTPAAGGAATAATTPSRPLVASPLTLRIKREKSASGASSTTLRLDRSGAASPSSSGMASPSTLSLRARLAGRQGTWVVEDIPGQVDLYLGLEHTLTKLKEFYLAWPFLQKVRQVDAPGYYRIIKEPMHFAEMTRRLNTNFYRSKEHFQEDLDLIWSNCRTYNVGPGGKDILRCALSTEKHACKLMDQVPNVSLAMPADAPSIEALRRRKKGIYAPVPPSIVNDVHALPYASHAYGPVAMALPGDRYLWDPCHRDWAQRTRACRMVHVLHNKAQRSVPFGERQALQRDATQMGLYADDERDYVSLEDGSLRVASGHERPQFFPELEYTGACVPNPVQVNADAEWLQPPPATPVRAVPMDNAVLGNVRRIARIRAYTDQMAAMAGLSAAPAASDTSVEQPLADNAFDVPTGCGRTHDRFSVHALLRKTVAATVAHAGFHAASTHVLDTMTDLTAAYMVRFMRLLHTYRAVHPHHNHLAPVVADVLKHMGTSVTQLSAYHWLEVCHFGDHLEPRVQQLGKAHAKMAANPSAARVAQSSVTSLLAAATMPPTFEDLQHAASQTSDSNVMGGANVGASASASSVPSVSSFMTASVTWPPPTVVGPATVNAMNASTPTASATTPVADATPSVQGQSKAGNAVAAGSSAPEPGTTGSRLGGKTKTEAKSAGRAPVSSASQDAKQAADEAHVAAGGAKVARKQPHTMSSAQVAAGSGEGGGDAKDGDGSGAAGADAAVDGDADAEEHDDDDNGGNNDDASGGGEVDGDDDGSDVHGEPSVDDDEDSDEEDAEGDDEAAKPGTRRSRPRRTGGRNARERKRPKRLRVPSPPSRSRGRRGAGAEEPKDNNTTDPSQPEDTSSLDEEVPVTSLSSDGGGRQPSDAKSPTDHDGESDGAAEDAPDPAPSSRTRRGQGKAATPKRSSKRTSRPRRTSRSSSRAKRTSSPDVRDSASSSPGRSKRSRSPNRSSPSLRKYATRKRGRRGK